MQEGFFSYLIVVTLFVSVNKIPWCEQSNKSLSTALSHDHLVFQYFNKAKFGVFREFSVSAFFRRVTDGSLTCSCENAMM